MLITFATPHLNDPNVYCDWTNGGHTIGCSHNKVTQVGAIIIMVMTEKGKLVSAFMDR